MLVMTNGSPRLCATTIMPLTFFSIHCLLKALFETVTDMGLALRCKCRVAQHCSQANVLHGSRYCFETELANDLELLAASMERSRNNMQMSIALQCCSVVGNCVAPTILFHVLLLRYTSARTLHETALSSRLTLLIIDKL